MGSGIKAFKDGIQGDEEGEEEEPVENSPEE
jgi:hypothetical protein